MNKCLTKTDFLVPGWLFAQMKWCYWFIFLSVTLLAMSLSLDGVEICTALDCVTMHLQVLWLGMNAALFILLFHLDLERQNTINRN